MAFGQSLTSRKPSARRPTAAVIIDRVPSDAARSVGCACLGLEALSAVNFTGILRREGFSRRAARIARALVIA